MAAQGANDRIELSGGGDSGSSFDSGARTDSREACATVHSGAAAEAPVASVQIFGPVSFWAPWGHCPLSMCTAQLNFVVQEGLVCTQPSTSTAALAKASGRSDVGLRKAEGDFGQGAGNRAHMTRGPKAVPPRVAPGSNRTSRVVDVAHVQGGPATRRRSTPAGAPGPRCVMSRGERPWKALLDFNPSSQFAGVDRWYLFGRVSSSLPTLSPPAIRHGYPATGSALGGRGGEGIPRNMPRGRQTFGGLGGSMESCHSEEHAFVAKLVQAPGRRKYAAGKAV